MSGTTEIRTFRVDMPDEALDDLRRRIGATRLPGKELVDDRSQGVQLATIQQLARYWTTGYDWRRCEARLNALPQFTTEIDGVDIHFIHVKSRHQNALPLIITHGWPGSVIELLGVISPHTAPAVHGRVGERADDPEQLDHRAGPAVGDDQRQRVLVPRPDVDEVDVHPVDVGLELRQAVQFRLAPAPVVVGRPVARQLLQHRLLHALRSVGDQLLAGPGRRGDAAAKAGDRFLGHIDRERPDRRSTGRVFGCDRHVDLPRLGLVVHGGLAVRDGDPRTAGVLPPFLWQGLLAVHGRGSDDPSRQWKTLASQ